MRLTPPDHPGPTSPCTLRHVLLHRSQSRFASIYQRLRDIGGRGRSIEGAEAGTQILASELSLPAGAEGKGRVKVEMSAEGRTGAIVAVEFVERAGMRM